MKTNGNKTIKHVCLHNTWKSEKYDDKRCTREKNKAHYEQNLVYLHC